MTILANDVRALARTIEPMLKYEPDVRVDFSRADYPTILGAMIVIIGKGVSDGRSICSFLQNRGTPIDRATIDLLLWVFEGHDQRHCLWARDTLGRYSLIG